MYRVQMSKNKHVPSNQANNTVEIRGVFKYDGRIFPSDSNFIITKEGYVRTSVFQTRLAPSLPLYADNDFEILRIPKSKRLP